MFPVQLVAMLENVLQTGRAVWNQIKLSQPVRKYRAGNPLNTNAASKSSSVRRYKLVTSECFDVSGQKLSSFSG